MDGRWMQSFQRPPSTFLLIPDGRIRDHCRSETIVNEKKEKTNGRLASPLAPQQCGALSRQRGDRASESPHDLARDGRTFCYRRYRKPFPRVVEKLQVADALPECRSAIRFTQAAKG